MVTVREHCWVRYDLHNGRAGVFIPRKGRHRLRPHARPSLIGQLSIHTRPRSFKPHIIIIIIIVMSFFLIFFYFFIRNHRLDGRHYDRSQKSVFFFVIPIFFSFVLLFSLRRGSLKNPISNEPWTTKY